MKYFIKLFLFSILNNFQIIAQTVPILNYKIDQNKCVSIEVASKKDKYYLLNVSNNSNAKFTHFTSMKLGNEGTTILSEPLAAFPQSQYRIFEFDQNKPNDTDNDGFDDIREFNAPINQGPFNSAKQIDFQDGAVTINDRQTFKKLSYKGRDVINLDPHLVDLEFVKFYIIGNKVDGAYIYFMNSETHRSHGSFKLATKINTIQGFGKVANEMKGEIVFHPNVKSANGTLGVFRFEFEPNDSFSFQEVQFAFELIAANMPFLKNNLSYYPMPNAAYPLYLKEKGLFDNSRVPIILEKDIYGEIEYLAMNQTEGYGYLRKMTQNESPGFRDIVIYENLPNEMPKTAGIITAVPQTPLSHVNLRAIQDNIPNAFIKDPLDNSKIKSLIGKYVHFIVNQTHFTLEETTKDKVNDWYNKLRPNSIQTAKSDFSYTKILPLKSINFKMQTAFGAKCANLATMHTFGFKNETIPNGFGIPFYFYQKFMEHNQFYDRINLLLTDTSFVNNVKIRLVLLEKIRKDIEQGSMPDWMLNELGEMQKSFPKGTSIRCRSSTNNEDLVNFSGAGLYDSKTQKPTEGHISKSIKEVFASIWNFRAFEERDFYRIDHLSASMAILCHPNFKDEVLNGVAVSTDPLYHSNNTFYLNNQTGEDLITNPVTFSIPEEILLDIEAKTKDSYSIVRYSNTSNAKLILNEKYMSQMRSYLAVIHNQFKVLYNQQDNPKFAIEIEYKITKQGQLLIKQARPWLGPNTSTESIIRDDFLKISDLIKLTISPNPIEEVSKVTFDIPKDGAVYLKIFDLNGILISHNILGYFSAGHHIVDVNLKVLKQNNGILVAKLLLNDGIEIQEKSIRVVK